MNAAPVAASWPEDVSLFEGGALRRALERSPFARRWLEPPQRRALLVAVLAWLPLALLAAVAGDLTANSSAVPFIRDLQNHVRFLLSLPLLVYAQGYAARIQPAGLRGFLERDLVAPRDRERFVALLESAGRAVRSPTTEILLFAFVLVAGRAVWRGMSMPTVSTWYGAPEGADFRLTLAGLWLVFVAMPLFHVFQARWFFRLILWGVLLFRISRLELELIATHPDRAGGLGFLGARLHAFNPYLSAQGTALAGILAGRILYEGARLDAFYPELGAMVAVGLVLVLGPASVFLPALVRTKRTGRSAYGDVANRYVREFDRKWVQGEAPEAEPLVGSADVQSLADMANSYDVVTGMRPVPYGRDRVIGVAVALLLPISPLLLTMFPADELLRRLVQMVF